MFFKQVLCNDGSYYVSPDPFLESFICRKAKYLRKEDKFLDMVYIKPDIQQRTLLYHLT